MIPLYCKRRYSCAANTSIRLTSKHCLQWWGNVPLAADTGGASSVAALLRASDPTTSSPTPSSFYSSPTHPHSSYFIQPPPLTGRLGESTQFCCQTVVVCSSGYWRCIYTAEEGGCGGGEGGGCCVVGSDGWCVLKTRIHVHPLTHAHNLISFVLSEGGGGRRGAGGGGRRGKTSHTWFRLGC